LNTRGLTLIELVVTVALFSLVGLLLAASFTGATTIWRSTSASTDSQLALTKPRDDLTRDLQSTSFSTVQVTAGPSSLGYVDGDALWFLSAVDPATGRFMRKVDGTPFWQRNILYYSVVPNDHTGLFGYTCTGGSDGSGYDVQCPHKVLLRKVIDKGSPTDPTDESTEEELLTPGEVTAYLTRPNRFDTSSMLGEAGLSDVSMPTNSLLLFRCQLAPQPQWPREVRVELGAVSLATAAREVNIGSVPLSNTRFYNLQVLSLFPSLP